MFGGRYCEGSSRSYKLCNTEDCPANTVDYRSQQCAEFNSRQFRGWYYNWKPYTAVDGRSALVVGVGLGCGGGGLVTVRHCTIPRKVKKSKHWHFSIPDQDVCKLYCFADGYDFFFALASKVRDGTRCSPESSDVCIDGLCEVILSCVF